MIVNPLNLLLLRVDKRLIDVFNAVELSNHRHRIAEPHQEPLVRVREAGQKVDYLHCSFFVRRRRELRNVVGHARLDLLARGYSARDGVRADELIKTP
ncbi:MAG: hypothetical protein ACREJ4_03070 [Candidatus Methylomirabilaceae bacterium]